MNNTAPLYWEAQLNETEMAEGAVLTPYLRARLRDIYLAGIANAASTFPSVENVSPQAQRAGTYPQHVTTSAFQEDRAYANGAIAQDTPHPPAASLSSPTLARWPLQDANESCAAPTYELAHVGDTIAPSALERAAQIPSSQNPASTPSQVVDFLAAQNDEYDSGYGSIGSLCPCECHSAMGFSSNQTAITTHGMIFDHTLPLF